MPIKRSFCNSWHTACVNDYFCGSGDFFECDAYYADNLAANLAAAAAAAAAADGSGESGEDKGLVIGLSVCAAVAVVGILFAGYLVSREKRGKPVFSHDGAGVSS